MRSFSFSLGSFVLHMFSGCRPWSEEQPDQSSKRQLLEEQPGYDWQQDCSETVHCFGKQVHGSDPYSEAAMAATTAVARSVLAAVSVAGAGAGVGVAG
jgi:hypothetical protein